MNHDRSTEPSTSSDASGAPEPPSGDAWARLLPQLMRIQERILRRLREVREELEARTTANTLQRFRQRGGETADETFGQVSSAVEEAIRALNVFESEIRQEILEAPRAQEGDDLPDLPPHLSRFLSERARMSGFSYEVDRDPIRGWTIRWKEYTEDGTIRGYGQLFERPHAWIEE